jgi:RND family efflux transporter MFP subunit
MQNTPKRRSRKLVYGILAVVALGLLSLFWFSPPKKTDYLTATVQRTDLENAVLATGVLQALKQVEVGAQVSGQLKSLKVVLGQAVKKGDWLAEIDPVISQNTLAQEQAKLENLQAQKLAKEVRVKQAQLTWTRQQDMLAQDAAAKQDMESADAELRALRADAVSLEAQIRQQKLAVASAQTNLSYTRIVAPIDGDVVSISTLEGQTVVAAFQVPTLMKLADLSTMTVKAQVSEADVVRVKPGPAGVLHHPGRPRQALPRHAARGAAVAREDQQRRVLQRAVRGAQPRAHLARGHDGAGRHPAGRGEAGADRAADRAGRARQQRPAGGARAQAPTRPWRSARCAWASATTSRRRCSRG